jgi:cobalt-zinc-cadmium efflux system protein
MSDDHDHSDGPHGHEEHEHEEAGHAHGKVFGAAPMGRAFAVGIALNLAFVVVEMVYGVLAHSMALVADAAHNLGDVMGLCLAWGASVLARRKASAQRTYGLRRSTILAALANAILLFVAVGIVVWEAIGRLRSPQPVLGLTVIVVAAVGVGVNGVSAWMFARGKEHDVNVKAAFLHLASDAAVSLGVVVAGAVMLKTHWWWLDPAISIAVSLVIVVGTWKVLRESLDLALDAAPDHIDVAEVRAYLETLPGVVAIHDLHIWAMSTKEAALTAHLVMPQDACPPTFHRDLGAALKERFALGHTTVQVDSTEAPAPCSLEPGDGGRSC